MVHESNVGFVDRNTDRNWLKNSFMAKINISFILKAFYLVLVHAYQLSI